MAPHQPRLTRRGLLAGGAALAAGALAPWRRLYEAVSGPRLEGAVLGPAHAFAHRLRAGGFPAPASAGSTGVVVVGGGAAGLSAAWRLRSKGFEDFRVLELDEAAGGNARFGESPATAYPWGAHYLPPPDAGSDYVVELLRELGAVTGRDAAGRPAFDERMLCHAPEERLYVHGRWEEGLFPRSGASREDLAAWERFESRVEGFRRLKTRDGRPAFAVPMERSSRDPELLALDRLSFADWLARENLGGAPLLWYCDYACRDDFGARPAATSAWAGLHYFAARPADETVLTWPEGNGWLTRRLAEPLKERLKTGALVFRVEETRGGVEVDWLDAATGEARRVRAKAAVVCVPRFAAARVVPALAAAAAVTAAFVYPPWMTANLHVTDGPRGVGADPAWDNVLHRGDSLGYVNASHQAMGPVGRDSVWTYYRPFPDGDPAANRAALHARPWAAWKDMVLADLGGALPGLEASVKRLDVWIWGHGMVRPSVGFMWGKERSLALRPRGRIHFGHSDLSGFSLFEEAQFRGCRAAEAALGSL